MSYATLATIVTETGSAHPLETAIACADIWDAHLDAICISLSPGGAAALGYPFYDGIAIAPEIVERSTRALEELQTRVRDRLSTEQIRWTCRGRTGPAADALAGVARAARLADLAVLAHPGAEDDGGLASDTLQAMLFHTRVPVMLVDRAVPARFDRILIAWDGSEVALAAIRAALPLLHRAREVAVVTVDASEDTAGHDVAQMLDRHGISVEIKALPRGGSPIATTISRIAQEVDANLVVMGAYGHSRLREAVLGGVTRQLIDAPPCPLLVAR